jgi:hypothetical protein
VFSKNCAAVQCCTVKVALRAPAWCLIASDHGVTHTGEEPLVMPFERQLR